jgi:hypothetical protein
MAVDRLYHRGTGTAGPAAGTDRESHCWPERHWRSRGWVVVEAGCERRDPDGWRAQLGSYGDYDELDRTRAGLTEQQVNLFLGRLTGLLAAAPAPETASST